MSVAEAVARFFPAGEGYDHTQAKRLIRWLDSCGYAITAKEMAKAKLKGETKPLRHAA